MIPDRFGLTWRPELGVEILANRDRVDLVEIVVVDDHTDRDHLRQFRALSRQMPVTVHGVSLGLASATAADTRRMDRMARIVDAIGPEYWSEHLAFVRAGGIEIGHLAQPPRTTTTIEGAAANLTAATRHVGAAPLVENVSTLVDPPGSDLDEIEWVRSIVATSGCDLLLDLHNVLTDSVNLGFDPFEYIEAIPAHRVREIHLAGGRWVSDPDDPLAPPRVLDDHRHDIPPDVYELLEAFAARASHPLDVVLERDGDHPPFAELLSQLDLARAAVGRGRARTAS